MLPRLPHSSTARWVSRTRCWGKTCRNRGKRAENVSNNSLEHYLVGVSRTRDVHISRMSVCLFGLSVAQTDLANTERWIVARDEAEAKTKAAAILGCEADKVTKAGG